MQLEKGLPPNGVVPLLKEKVEKMRDRVCVISMLLASYISLEANLRKQIFLDK